MARTEVAELLPDDLLEGLATRADVTDRRPEWPAESWQAVGRAGVLEWSIPTEYGGRALDGASAPHGYERITGAVLEDGRQVLLVVPADAPGVRVDPPMDLTALAGSRTASVHCDGVRVERHWLLAGPAERVLSTARGGTGGLETSCLALGLA